MKQFIRIVRKTDDYWEAIVNERVGGGNSVEEAIGDLVLTYKEYFYVDIDRSQG